METLSNAAPRRPHSGRERRRKADGSHLRALDGDGEWTDIDSAIGEIDRLDREEPTYRATLLPDESQVTAGYVSVERGRVAKGAYKWLALFQILEADAAPEAVGRVILRSWNEPNRGWVSPKHALARDFAAVCRMALRSLPPNATPNAILGSFLRGVWILARTHTVTGYVDPGTRQFVSRPAWDHYSVISAIEGVAAGSPAQPRFLSRRRR